MDTENIDYGKLYELIDLRRKEKGVRLSVLAEQAEVSERTIHRILRGYQSAIRPSLLEKLLDALEISSDELPLIQESTPKSKGKHIFISYSHRDKAFLERLLVHLKPLERQGLIDSWVDTRLLAGEKWKKEIDKALKNARVAVLLVSADFLASDFVIDNELPPLLHSAEEKGTLIIPVILKPCRFTREKNIREFQSINPPDEPLTFMDDNDREVVYDAIAQRIEQAFE